MAGMRKVFRYVLHRRRLWGYCVEAEVALKTLFRRELPEPRFVIFAQGRSGSTLLCELLGSHSKIHCDSDEILSDPVRNVRRYLRHSALASTQSAYGFKVKIYQLTKRQQVGNVADFLQRLHKDGWQIVYLVRRNLFRQAFSGQARRVRGTALTRPRRDGLAPPRPLVHVDVKKIVDRMRWRQRIQNLEQEALKGLPFKTLVYEDDLYQPADQQRTVGALVEWLGLTPEPVHTNLIPNTPRNLREMIANFGELEVGLRDTEFEAYFWEATGG